MSDSVSGKFWFCRKHHRVESGAGHLPAHRPARPVPDPEEAERALTKAAERNEEWDNDPNWNDDSPE